MAGQVLRTRRTQHLDDELNRARVRRVRYRRTRGHAAGGLVVPLVFRGHIYGVLLALDRLEDGPRFSADDQRLLEAFATSAATAVATAQSVASEQQRQRLAAAEGERGRWARDLHDETLQSLSALQIRLATARRVGRRRGARGGRRRGDRAPREGIGDLRALITDLRPAALDELGVEAALEALAERDQAPRDRGRRQHRPRLREGHRDRPPAHAGARDRALPDRSGGADATPPSTGTRRARWSRSTRTTRHGASRRSRRRRRLRSVLRGTDGFGLLGMRERVQLLDGTLRVESTPGDGTVVQASIPIQRRTSDLAAAADG